MAVLTQQLQVAPPRGAWIEIDHISIAPVGMVSLPRGERGLKLPISYQIGHKNRSLPRGERGLKWGLYPLPTVGDGVAPPRGAWIEIPTAAAHAANKAVAPPRGAWIEIETNSVLYPMSVVAPPRGAWIEISGLCCCRQCRGSLPRGERGLKCPEPHYLETLETSLPRGERGLKYLIALDFPATVLSLPRGERGLK